MTANLTDDQLAQVQYVRGQYTATHRPTVMALEEMLYEPVPLLDHGFLRVIDYMGDDAAIVQAARVSYGRGTRRVSEDAGLIRYLMRHRHSTPFEMCEIKYHVKLLTTRDGDRFGCSHAGCWLQEEKVEAQNGAS